MSPFASLSSDELRALVRRRQEKAWEAVADVHLALAHQRWTNAVNRMYYALFYMVSALALLDGFSTSKHKQLIGWFNKTYIATGILERRLKDILVFAFEQRTEGDYADWATFTAEDVVTLAEDMEYFIAAMERYIAGRIADMV